MPNIVHRIGIESSPEPVYEALATKAGVASWWTETVTGESKVGANLQFKFPDTGPEFKVLELSPNKQVRWECVAGPEDWLGTRIHFDISFNEGETTILFKHCGWREELPFMYHCSSQWAYFLFGLKAELEAGQGAPFGPRFKPISRWSPESA